MLRFTTRDLLWLMAVVAMGFAWWADRTAINVSRADCESRLLRLDDYLHATQAQGVVSNENVTYVVPPNGGDPILVSKR